MPGIVGLITRMPRERAEPQLLRMVEAIRHESFYEKGTWVDDSLGVYVGWTARKNSFSNGMPLTNEEQSVSLVFSGEEYPEPGISHRLKQYGHSLDHHGPSYLVHLYEEDKSFPLILNGMFHGLLTDRRLGTTTLFNDRFGMHRVCYHESNDAFYFAAEGCDGVGADGFGLAAEVDDETAIRLCHVEQLLLVEVHPTPFAVCKRRNLKEGRRLQVSARGIILIPVDAVLFDGQPCQH